MVTDWGLPKASLWSIDSPGIAKVARKQAFRERKVADIVLPKRKVGVSLFDKPPLHGAWAIKATQHQGRGVLFRELWHVSQGNEHFFRSDNMRGTISQLQARGIRRYPRCNSSIIWNLPD